MTELCVCPSSCQNVSPSGPVRFIWDHHSEWADFNVDAYSAASLRAVSYAYPGMRPTRFAGIQIIMLFGHTIGHEGVCHWIVFCPSLFKYYYNDIWQLHAVHFKCVFYSIIILSCSITSISDVFSCLKLFDLKGILLNKKMLLNQETFIYCRWFLSCYVSVNFSVALFEKNKIKWGRKALIHLLFCNCFLFWPGMRGLMKMLWEHVQNLSLLLLIICFQMMVHCYLLVSALSHWIQKQYGLTSLHLTFHIFLQYWCKY